MPIHSLLSDVNKKNMVNYKENVKFMEQLVIKFLRSSTLLKLLLEIF